MNRKPKYDECEKNQSTVVQRKIMVKMARRGMKKRICGFRLPVLKEKEKNWKKKHSDVAIANWHDKIEWIIEHEMSEVMHNKHNDDIVDVDILNGWRESTIGWMVALLIASFYPFIHSFLLLSLIRNYPAVCTIDF